MLRYIITLPPQHTSAALLRYVRLLCGQAFSQEIDNRNTPSVEHMIFPSLNDPSTATCVLVWGAR